MAETVQQHIFTLATLLSVADKDESMTKSVATLTTLVIVIFTILGISVSILEKYRFKSSLMRVCFPLFQVSKWVSGTKYSEIFIEIVNTCTSKTIRAYFTSMAIVPIRLKLTGY